MDIRKVKDTVILKMSEDDLNESRATFAAVEDLLKIEGERKLVLDLSAIDSIYSLQIGTLVTIHVLCYENVAVMTLAGANEKVKALLKMVGLDALMEMHHGVDIALKSLGHTEVLVASKDSKDSKRRTRPAKPVDPRVRR